MMESSRLKRPSPGRIWSGRILSALLVLFFLFDAITKIARAPQSVQATVQTLGYPESAIGGIGWVLLISTILYAIPRTAFFGAILLTGYLGGAIASGVRAGVPASRWVFPFVIGVLVWIALWLRDRRLEALL